MSSLNEVETHLNEVVLGVTRHVMKASAEEMNGFHEEFPGSTKLYLYLSDYFQQKAAAEQQAKQIAITSDVARKVIREVLISNLTPELLNKMKLARSAGNSEELFSTELGPYTSQKNLKEQLSGLKGVGPVNMSAYAEVLEVCRYLDHVQKTNTPFGAVNVFHFVAVFVSLTSTDSLFDLIQLVWETPGLPEIARMKIFHLWAVIDRANASAFESLINAMLERPNLTIPILLEIHPEMRLIHTSHYQATAVQTESTAGGPAVASYEAEDEGKGNTSASVAGQQPIGKNEENEQDDRNEGEDGGEELLDDEELEELRREAGAEQGDFWNALVS